MALIALENPGLHWVELVVALRGGLASEIQDIINVAKESEWNMEKWEDIMQAECDAQQDAQGSDTEDWDEDEAPVSLA